MLRKLFLMDSNIGLKLFKLVFLNVFADLSN